MTPKQAIIHLVAKELQDIANGLLLFSNIAPITELIESFNIVSKNIIDYINRLNENLNVDIDLAKVMQEKNRINSQKTLINNASTVFLPQLHFPDKSNNNQNSLSELINQYTDDDK